MAGGGVWKNDQGGNRKNEGQGFSVSRMARELRRSEYFAGLFILGCVSGFTSRITQSANRLG
jgi:hypothetical protein